MPAEPAGDSALTQGAALQRVADGAGPDDLAQCAGSALEGARLYADAMRILEDIEPKWGDCEVTGEPAAQQVVRCHWQLLVERPDSGKLELVEFATRHRVNERGLRRLRRAVQWGPALREMTPSILIGVLITLVPLVLLLRDVLPLVSWLFVAILAAIPAIVWIAGRRMKRCGGIDLMRHQPFACHAVELEGDRASLLPR